MNNLNSILLEGNLTKDPGLKKIGRGTSVCAFSVACNRYFRQDDDYKEEVSFFDVEVWGRLADVCGNQLKKGRGVRVVGRLKQDRWSDEGNKPHSRVKIVGEHVEFKPERKNYGQAPPKVLTQKEPAYATVAEVPAY